MNIVSKAEVEEKFSKGKLNSRFILMRTEPNAEGNFWLNIMRKVRPNNPSEFSAPIQRYICQNKCRVRELNRGTYKDMEPLVFYDVANDALLVTFITAQTKFAKTALEKLEKDQQRNEERLLMQNSRCTISL